MKIRLQITASPGTSFSFEHTGPNVRLGRDPDGELALAGEANQSVSWNHARIELTPSGAFLSDLNSTNGTFLNDKRIVARTAFKRGDQIQLGYTGPMLKVVELELSKAPVRVAVPPAQAPAQTPGRPEARVEPDLPRTPVSRAAGLGGATTSAVLLAMQRTQRNMLIGGGVLGAGLVILVIALLWRPWQSEGRLPNPDSERNPELKTVQESRSPVKPSPVAPEVVDPGRVVTPVVPPPSDPQRSQPSEVARYMAKSDEPPSVLLQRERDPDPWGRLRPGDPVRPGYYLVSLPGYRSKVLLPSGVQLTLWGNVPEFSPFPPVLESTIMLNVPAPDIDLDFTLDRGRVHLANHKPTGKAHVRVRFHQEAWDLVLPDNKSEAALELWGLYDPQSPAAKEPGEKVPLACVGLFVKGGAHLKTRTREYALADLSQFEWVNRARAVEGPKRMPHLPAWWTPRLDLKGDSRAGEAIKDVLLALNDLSDELGKTDAVLDGVVTQVRKSLYPVHRRVGVLCLGALDAVSAIVDALEDPTYLQVRWAAIYALQVWISRSPDFDQEVYRTLHEKNGYPKEHATLLWRLLHSFDPAERADPKTYELLIGCLNHEKLAIRELASRQLMDLVPQLARDIDYDPAGNLEARTKAVQRWQQKIPPGTRPATPALATGTHPG